MLIITAVKKQWKEDSLRLKLFVRNRTTKINLSSLTFVSCFICLTDLPNFLEKYERILADIISRLKNVIYHSVIKTYLLIETKVGLQITNSKITAESYYDIFIARLGSFDSTWISHLFSNCFCHIRHRNLWHWWN